MTESEKMLNRWYELREKIERNKRDMAVIVEEEFLLRQTIMKVLWPELKEGTNKFELPQGYVLKGVHKIDRKVDAAVLPYALKQLQDMQIATDGLVRHTPEVNIKTYRLLPDNARKIFDTCLLIKPAAPTLEIVPPKVKE